MREGRLSQFFVGLKNTRNWCVNTRLSPLYGLRNISMISAIKRDMCVNAILSPVDGLRNIRSLCVNARLSPVDGLRNTRNCA